MRSFVKLSESSLTRCKTLFAMAMMLPIGACATASFAPPDVNTQTRTVIDAPSVCRSLTADSNANNIERNVLGAITLTDNFELAYRCAERELADGRQYFQVPGFLAAVAGLIGPTLGMSSNAVLLAGAGAGVLNAGNSYYAPKAKAAVLSAAHRAVLCIKQESVGVSYFKLKEDGKPATTHETKLRAALAILQSQAQQTESRRSVDSSTDARLAANWAQQQDVVTALVRETLDQASQDANAGVLIDAEVQYFEMVAGALLSVHSIMSERLRDSGSIDTTDLFNKLKELAKQHTDAENALNAKKTVQGFVGPLGLLPAASQREMIRLENAALQPKLQTCVLQARAS